MIRGLFWIWQLQPILLHLVNYSVGIKYEFILEDERIFSECSDQAPGTLNIDGMIDTSDVKFAMADDGVSVSGSNTITWDVQPSDRIEMAASLRYFDRGTWQPTTLNMLIKDFCKVMYDQKQIWYDFYSGHVVNRADVEANCVTVKGTRHVLESFTLDPHIGLGMPLKPGRYSVQIQLSAFDKSNLKRSNSVCFQIKGAFFKA